jgi:competence protein ComEC
MEPKLISKGKLGLIMGMSLLITAGVFFITLVKDSPKTVFCNVGQGDGTYIRTVDHEDIVIDAGPDGSMSECLGRYMPFYDKTIEFAFLSHPQKDHYGGFNLLTNHYKINTFVTNLIQNSMTFSNLLNKLQKNNTHIVSYFEGDIVKRKSYSITFLWPSKKFFFDHSFFQYGKRISSHDLNSFSQVFIFESNTLRILFTGDIDPQTSLSIKDIGPVTILKVPHHGSINGLTANLLARSKPQLAVISVGVKNAFGHPSKAILSLLKTFHIQIRRTDREGDIVIDY